MAQQFLKNLECLCVRGVSGTCPGGGHISAKLSTSPAALTASIVSKSSVTSAPERFAARFEGTIEGDGPFYVIRLSKGGFSTGDWRHEEALDIAREKGGAIELISSVGGVGECHYDIIKLNILDVYADDSILVKTTGNGFLGASDLPLSDSCSKTTTHSINISSEDDRNYNLPLRFVRLAVLGHREKPKIVPVRGLTASLGATSSLGSPKSIPQIFAGLGKLNRLTSTGTIKENMLAQYSAGEKLKFTGHLTNTFTDKIAGTFSLFGCEQKLYPSGDLPIDAGFGSFIGPLKESGNLHTFVDEGVFAGIVKDGGDSYRVADDRTTFINPGTIHTEGLFQYKCELTDMNVRPQDSHLRMRISAPLQNMESKIAPQYTVYNIKFSDPSGNLIVKYNDIVLRGDAEKDDVNYATYSTSPKENVVSEKYDWQRTLQPHMHETSGYRLSFSVRAVALDDAFDSGFSEGFEENYVIPDIITSGNTNYLALDGEPLSSQESIFINPTAGFKVSAIEICNSGGVGPRTENYIPIYAESPKKGRRLERSISPTFMPIYNFDTTIYPSVTSVWQSEGAVDVFTNETDCGSEELIKILRTPDTLQSIQLTDQVGGNIADSGKLILRFDYAKDSPSEITKGSFNIEFDQGTKEIWWQPSGSFNTENKRQLKQSDIPFASIDTLTLKVMAKKGIGDRDYVFDVVGYSDDKLLNVTSPSGGFIQNPSGVHLNDTFIPSLGTHPVFSGFYANSNELALNGTSISEREKYFETSGNFGGDHYSLTQYPIVTDTDFKLYEVPLKIADDIVRLGVSRNYSLSSLLEKVYLDIFPIPSGAEIAHISLDVRYAPQDALNMSTLGGEHVGRIQDGRSEGALYPRNMQSNDHILNAGSGYGPLSLIEGIPHGFQTPSSIKSNYSRRWRGVEGTMRGPYDPDAFGFSFENPVIDYPFLSGYYKFDVLGPNNRYIKSSPLGPITPNGLGTVSGLSNVAPEIYQNVGWRFSSGTLFNDQLPNYSGNYTTTDWTSLSQGSNTFVGNPMYGKIADAVDRVIRVSGNAQNINFGNIDTTSGFSIFTRFTPDANVSGVGYNLFDSGVIFAKWDSASQLDFALGYSGGFLCGFSQDKDGSVVAIKDTIPYSGYLYPVNVLLTYNDNESSGLKLYVESESQTTPYEGGDFNPSYDTPRILRASGGPFYKNTTSADLVLGYGAGSGVGMNMLVSDFGISTWSSGVDTLYGTGTNIVESNPDKTYKQVTAEKFFENIRVTFFDPEVEYGSDRYKLWDRVNEDTYNDWNIGDFKYCHFNRAFSCLGSTVGKRPNAEQIIFDLKHHGSGYSSYNDLVMPSSVDSGVAYHTQIENDFLRFHLSDVPNHFHSVNRRITKNLPVGYKFSEKALVVESVIEHHTDNTIEWPACGPVPHAPHKLEGPKLIVSLYTKKQEPYWTTTENNWGLINRKTHYLEPSSCFMRLDSTFSYDDLLDESEEWAKFPKEPVLKDFKERLFSDDVNDMFVQYDLVYPSGPAFESKIQLHSSHVRMSYANIEKRFNNAALNFNVSGAFPSTETLNLILGEIPRPASGLLPLLIQVPQPVDNLATSGLPMNVSGALRAFATLPLFTPEWSISNLPTSGLPLNVDGINPIDAGFNKFNLSLPKTFASLGHGGTSNSREEKFSEGFATEEEAIAAGSSQGLIGSHLYKKRYYPGSPDDYPVEPGHGPDQKDGVYGYGPAMPLFMLNSDDPSIDSIPLFSYGASGLGGGYSHIPLYINNSNTRSKGSTSGSMQLRTIGIGQLLTTIREAEVPLFIKSPNIISGILPLTLGYTEADPVASPEQMNLFTASYPVGSKGVGSAYGFWHNNDFGTGIEIEDNHLATVAVDNEIRGVDLVGYGSCTGNSPSKAFDQALQTDDTIWRPKTCNEGGIFRAKNTYSNSGCLAFDGVSIGYSGNYYGIRKFTKLLPSQVYNVEMKIRTGSTEPIPVPRTFEEWEYGMCGPNWFANGCCTEDCDQDIVFSGVKLVGDDSNFDIDPELLVASGRGVEDKYGYKVSVKGDLMAVAAPNIAIPEYDIYSSPKSTIDVSGAGAVFLYRRDADVAGKKAGWKFADQLMLPTGFRSDYIEFTVENLIDFDQFTISGNKWQIGQNGREFGSSLDMCSSGTRETLVVGAPRAKWNREFQDLATSGIPCGTLVISDLFQYSKKDIGAIAGAAKRFDILWKYFSAPWNGGTPEEFQASIDMKTVVLQPVYSTHKRNQIPAGENWLVHRYIDRLDDFDLLVKIGKEALGGAGKEEDWFKAGQPIVFNRMASGLYDAVLEAFPNTSDAIYSGAPAIMGMFKEKTGSTAGALQYKDSSNVTHNIYDEAIALFNSLTYHSGVYDQTTMQAATGHMNVVEGKSENWATTTRSLIFDTFDSGRLSRTFTDTTINRDFITSGVGQEWGDSHAFNVREFQIPPHSGGRVYVFEKERDDFNCVQIITSPNDVTNFEDAPEGMMGGTPNDHDEYLYFGQEFNDRFGHSVGISTNSEVLTIGSPFSSSPCRIYQRDDSENTRLYAGISGWLQTYNKSSALSHFGQILAESGMAKAQESTYDHISQNERLSFRTDKSYWKNRVPQLYKLTFTYGYGDIKYVGTNSFLSSFYAPMSRLGWSTAVSDNGDLVAFGAPTDSFNAFEDVNVYAEHGDSWASYQYAGAVRMFQNRKVVPHSGVIEFGRFGNLDRSTHKTERDAGFYDQMGLYFGANSDGTTEYTGKYFRRTDFSEIEIPRDAGLAFITTPELDAASDEVIDNIKNWLALGDRNLVLVGNDPLWEEDGLYEDSNNIINKILENLGSRMRIHPAKNEEMSMQGCVSESDKLDNKYNITTSFRPKNGSSRTLLTGNYYAKGVGDIRIDLSKDKKETFKEYMGCPEGSNESVINDKCEFPLMHNGDLRAQWEEECVRTIGDKKILVRYQNNWPLQFQNYKPNCDFPPRTIINTPNFEPVPVLTTAEHLPDRYWVVPESSGRFSEWETIYASSIIEKNEPYADFMSPIDSLEFDIQEDINSDPSGTFDIFNIGGFIDPPRKNGRDGLIQGVASLVAGKPEYETIKLYDESILAIVESGRETADTFNNSRAYLIATDWSEDNASRLGTVTNPTTNEDKNTEFYLNLVQENCEDAARGIHLGGWTGHASLAQAYYGDDTVDSSIHSLSNKFKTELLGRGGNGYFRENQTFASDDIQIPDEVNFVWIASPLNKPSDADLSRLKNWFNSGNKKLIITYTANNEDTRQDVARNVDYICEKLNISSRPFYVPNDGEYFVTDKVISSWSAKDEEGNRGGGGAYEQFVNNETDSLSGCKNGFDFTPAYNESTAVGGLFFNPDTKTSFGSDMPGMGEQPDRRRFIPISGGSDYEKIVWFDPDITTVVQTVKHHYKMDKKGTFSFPTIQNSGYRIFFNWVSETDLDTCCLLANAEGVHWSPRPCDYFPTLPNCIDQGEDDPPQGNINGQDVVLCKTLTGEPSSSYHIDVVSAHNEIKLNFNTNDYTGRVPDNLLPNGIPHTVRLLSISGVPIPIDSGINTTRYWKKRKVGQREVNVRWEVFPATSGLIKGVSRPVMHKSRDYCDPNETDAPCLELGDTLIQDGPVVVAEEYENFSSFTTGEHRSKIIVVADSTMIQGQCAHYRSEATVGNQAFIRSLYPQSPESISLLGNTSNFLSPVAGFSDEFEPEAIHNGDKNFFFAQKLRAPERGSVSKYHAVSGSHINNMTEPLYNGMGGVVGSLNKFTDAEDNVAPSLISRPTPIVERKEQEDKIKNWGIAQKSEYGVFPRFSGDFLNFCGGGGASTYKDWPGNPLGLTDKNKRDWILDGGVGGGLTDLMMLKNTDYLDLDVYYSGCLGDLFGYSVDLVDDKLAVGTPFNGFVTEGAASGVSGIVQWHEIQNDPHFSGMRVAEDGGAGAVFYFEKTGSGKNAVNEFLPWEFGGKIKPSSINVGIIDFSPSPSQALTRDRGAHNIDDSSFISEFARRSDNFGYSVSIDSDMIVAGAPNHDFATLHHHIYSGSIVPNDLNTAFQRKSFDGAFDIPLHSFYDLGSSGVRIDEFEDASGTMILNNGAVFNYRYELIDYPNRKKEWIYAEKLYSQGYNERVGSEYVDILGVPYISVSGTENDNFGWSVCIDRAGRGDSDYTFVGGAPHHDWPTSGNHTTSGLRDAGSAYTFDAMLRGQTPTIPSNESWIDTSLFGGSNHRDLFKRVYQNTEGAQEIHEVSGVLVTNSNGDAFIEVSGFDPSTKGFVAHRPYVESVKFVLTNGEQATGNFNLNITGKPVEFSGNMPLSVLGADQANVYNTMNTYLFGVSGHASGVPSGLPLFMEVASGSSSGTLNLNMGSNQTIANLELRIRGF